MSSSWAELRGIGDEHLAQDTQEGWIGRLNATGVPCGRVLDFNEVFAGPQIVKQQMAIDVEHPGRGAVRMLGLPVKLDRTPCAVRQPSPALGVHTAEVLAAAGYSAAEIGRLGPG